jgi:hypothetical protein
MLIFQPPVNFCSDENIHFWNKVGRSFKLSDRLQFNIPNCRKSCEKNIFSAPKAPKIGDRQVLVEPTMALLWRPLDVLLFRRPKNIFFTTFSTVWDIKL